VLRKQGLCSCAMTRQLGKPSIEDLFDRGPVAQPEDTSMIRCYENVPVDLPIVVVTARERQRWG